MMATARIANPRERTRLPAPPAAPDGHLFPYEMIYAGGSWRGYADEPGELLTLLIDSYADLDDDQARLRARIQYAVDVSVPLQADAAAEGDLDGCTGEQRAVLLAPRDVPPPVTEWAAPVPLVLVTSFYAPVGELPRPAAVGGGEITWIDPLTEESLLVSLYEAGWINLAARTPAYAAVLGAAG
jgi:hypothetical protein